MPRGRKPFSGEKKIESQQRTKLRQRIYYETNVLPKNKYPRRGRPRKSGQYNHVLMSTIIADDEEYDWDDFLRWEYDLDELECENIETNETMTNYKEPIEVSDNRTKHMINHDAQTVKQISALVQDRTMTAQPLSSYRRPVFQPCRTPGERFEQAEAELIPRLLKDVASNTRLKGKYFGRIFNYDEIFYGIVVGRAKEKNLYRVIYHDNDTQLVARDELIRSLVDEANVPKIYKDRIDRIVKGKRKITI